MSLYTYKSRSYEISYNPKELTLGVSAPGRIWSWTGDAYIEIAGSRVSLEGKYISSSERKTGIGIEFKAEYRGFSDKCELSDLALITTVSVDFDSEELIFECRLENELDNAVQRIAWPKPFAFGAAEGEGYTLLSRMQGSIIPAKYEKTLSGGSWDGIIFERDSYMPVYGQVVSSNGYVMIYDTPYDALYHIDHEPGGRYPIGRLDTRDEFLLITAGIILRLRENDRFGYVRSDERISQISNRKWNFRLA